MVKDTHNNEGKRYRCLKTKEVTQQRHHHNLKQQYSNAISYITGDCRKRRSKIKNNNNKLKIFLSFFVILPLYYILWFVYFTFFVV